ncbi:CoA-binding protein [Pontiella agarivorans]|uniref:CoA-binding protein n=1 Tax=Pontiella agarivorans TaxID=3038953 RepID=A0ABU5MWQ7_9BACT|nr:CoA-binding protein [Pontiella agarivorans]MDZ8118620.1 CoA-binding protein [Pontiella agarivorans]
MKKSVGNLSVVVLGASPKPERYANRAVHLLLEKGYSVLPVHPSAEHIAGLSVYAKLPDIGTAVHTVTVYLSAARSSALADDLMALGPRRVIFNPGAENPKLQLALLANGIDVLEACTLVLLNTGQF